MREVTSPAGPRLPLPTLRYAIHLIGAAALISQRRKAAAVEIEDVSKAYTLFLDVKRSVQYLQVRAGLLGFWPPPAPVRCQ